MKARPAAALAALLLAAGCASFSPDGGMALVDSSAGAGIGKETVKIASEDDARRARERVAALLAEPLDADAAVQVALLSNRGLQAAYNELGLSEADLVAAGLPANPRLSLSRLAGDGVVELELKLLANLLSLLTLPARQEIAEQRFAGAQYRAVEATFRLAAETRRAFIRAVAAQQAVRELEAARESADAAADLMRRLGRSGAASKFDQGRTSVFHAELGAQLAQARLRARLEREALTRRLGLWGSDAEYRLPDALPPLPGAVAERPDVEEEAIRRRVDLIMARRELDATARAFGLAEATRYVSLLELAGLYNRETEPGEEGGRHRVTRLGPELEIEIPIFDFGEVGSRRARETYLRAVNRLAEKAVNARSEARAAYQAYRAAADIARQYQDRVLPLRRLVSDEALLRYNGMLIDVFELLSVERERIMSALAATEARRDFFLAEAALQAALIGGGEAASDPGDSPTAAPATAPAH